MGNELIKLYGIAYHDNELRVEDATLTRKRTNNNTSNKSRRLFVVVNNYPQNQHSYGRRSSASESKFSKRIFDSIPRGIKLHEFNYWLHNSYVQVKSFPDGTSKKLLYYVELTFKNKKFDFALLHVGVNELVKPRLCLNSSEQLEANWLRCKSAGVKRILISAIVVNN